MMAWLIGNYLAKRHPDQQELADLDRLFEWDIVQPHELVALQRLGLVQAQGWVMAGWDAGLRERPADQ